MAKKKPKKTLKRPAASAPKKKVVKAKKAAPVKKPAKAKKAKKAVAAKKAAPPAKPKPAASRRPSPSAPAIPPAPSSLAPLRVPDVIVPDPQEVYDESINEFEADAARESETDRQPDEEPGTSTQRQAEHPAPSSHRAGKRPRGIPAKKPQDA
jgi:hypothetical protein